MAIFTMIFRKMVKNKWLELSLLFGLVISVALTSMIPIYSQAIFKRMLVKDLEHFQTEKNIYPGTFEALSFFSGSMIAEDRQTYLHHVDQYFNNTFTYQPPLPIMSSHTERDSIQLSVKAKDPAKRSPSINRHAQIVAFSNMTAHIRLIDGRLPADKPINHVFEALVTEQALTQFNMVLGDQFIVPSTDSQNPIYIKPVGVFKVKNDQDLYWGRSDLQQYPNTKFYINFKLFDTMITYGNLLSLDSSEWYYTLDYSKINWNSASRLIQLKDVVEQELYHSQVQNGGTYTPAFDTIKQDYEKQKKLYFILWSLEVPILILLGLYLLMVSNMIVDRQKTEIAVFRSRGASRVQIIMIYLLEGLFLGGIALIIGPWIGNLLTQFLGASNGFLDFVNRSALETKISSASYEYAVYTVIASIMMTLIPVYIATKSSIVNHKGSIRHTGNQSVLHRFFIDIILLLVSGYGYYIFLGNLKNMKNLGVNQADLQVDPLLFVVPTLFILGFGLFLLRIFPYFIKGVFWIGRKWWSPAIYSSLLQVGRASRQYQMLMIFLILTIATGLFSASAARTINKNSEEQIRYQNGADIVMQTLWDSRTVQVGNNDSQSSSADTHGEPPQNSSSSFSAKRYVEPPPFGLENLQEVQHTAKVYVRDNVNFTYQKTAGTAKLIGINTYQFGNTTWFKDSLNPYPLNDYLNLIARNPSAILVSKSLADAAGIHPGDQIQISWQGTTLTSFTVYGIVNYFPTFNPNSTKEKKAPMLIVGNLHYIQNYMALEPYQIWIKLKPNASRNQLMNDLTKKQISILDFTDTNGEITVLKNDPFYLSINGVMTLGFLISITVSFIGFLLFWILLMRTKVMEFGTLRAMGISLWQIVMMLIMEQLLISCAAIFIGIITGILSSQLFVSFFQMSFSIANLVPPFQVIHNLGDFLKLLEWISAMLLLGLLILGFLISRIQIHRALRLGEDS